MKWNYAAFLSLAALQPLAAQFDAAEVLGTVRDASGAVVENAAVALLNQNTGVEARTYTDSSGNYAFSKVKIGSYTITAEAPGFARAVARDVAVNINARQRVNLTLQVGARTESIEVTGAASLLQTDSSERGQLVRAETVVGLPLNGRAYSDLALLTTGVVKSPSASSGTPREGSFVVNGLRSVYNNFLLDGVDNNAYGTSNQGFSNQVAQPPPDAVAEFKVITNNYSAEYGRSGGATIDVALRSGTNALHGTAYNFLRNTSLNAVGYVFGVRPSSFRKPTLQQNQFGATIGGPFVRNRVFFFGDYEGFRSLSRTLTFASLPSLEDRQGILPVTVRNPLTGAVYPARTPIPPTDITPFARKILSDLPAPTGPGRSNNYQQLSLDRNYNDKFDVKLDGYRGESLAGFLRLSQRKVNIFNEPNIPGPSGGNSNGFTRVLNQVGSAGLSWTVTPQTLVEGRFAVSRTRAGKEPPLVGGPSMLALYGIPGLPEDPALTGGLTPQLLSGFSQLGRQATNPQFQHPLTFDWKFNLSRVSGRHTLKAGYEFMAIRIQVNDVNPLYGRDAYAGGFSRPPGGPADAASYSLADFYFGLRSQYALANYLPNNFRQHMHFWYVQDDYRVTPRLTVNLGLRYEYATPRWERDNLLSNFDPQSRTMVQARNGDIASRALVDPDYNNFAPRLGFAYSWMDKTVLRGGYGIGYMHQNRVGSADLLGINGPHVVIATVNQSDPLAPTFRTTQQGYPSGLTDPSNFNPALANVTYIPKDYRTSYVQSFFLSVQRELWANFVLDIGYVGNRAIGLPVIGDYNQAAPQPTPTSNLPLAARRPIPSFGAITYFYPGAFSNYNALQLKLERRFSEGLSLLNSFTWGKAIDTAAQTLDTSNGNDGSPQDIRNMAAERGVSNYDQTFTNMLSVIYDLPFGRGQRWGASLPTAADVALGGWQLTFINTSLSAPPVNLRAWAGAVPAAFQVVGNLPGFRGGETFRPNVLGGSVLAANPQDRTNTYFDPDKVVLPSDPSRPFGNAGRNSVRALPFHQLDLGVFKNFRLPREDMRLQFRAEFFNLLNHTNFRAPNSDRNSPAFGTIRSTFEPRQIQFALKFLF